MKSITATSATTMPTHFISLFPWQFCNPYHHNLFQLFQPPPLRLHAIPMIDIYHHHHHLLNFVPVHCLSVRSLHQTTINTCCLAFHFPTGPCGHPIAPSPLPAGVSIITPATTGCATAVDYLIDKGLPPRFPVLF